MALPVRTNRSDDLSGDTGAGDGEGVAALAALESDGFAEGLAEKFRGQAAGEGCGSDDGAGAEEEGVAEAVDDLLDVMGDQDERRGAGLGGEASEELEEMFAGDGVESGAGFIEDQESGIGHQGAADEDALAFALG